MVDKTLRLPKKVYIYNEGIKEFKQKNLTEFIRDNFPSLKIKIIKQQSPIVQTKGIVLDLPATVSLFEKIKIKHKDSVHIILTKRLFATLDQAGRLHIRSSLFSYPSIISASGIVEGPAKPRDYYLLKTRYSSLKIWELKEAEVKEKFKNRFIDYGDSRINEVIKGLVSQSLFFYITGEPFCEKRSCRLFNAHWQEDLIYSQIKKGKFCPRHKKMLEGVQYA